MFSVRAPFFPENDATRVCVFTIYERLSKQILL